MQTGSQSALPCPLALTAVCKFMEGTTFNNFTWIAMKVCTNNPQEACVHNNLGLLNPNNAPACLTYNQFIVLCSGIYKTILQEKKTKRTQKQDFTFIYKIYVIFWHTIQLIWTEHNLNKWHTFKEKNSQQHATNWSFCPSLMYHCLEIKATEKHYLPTWSFKYFIGCLCKPWSAQNDNLVLIYTIKEQINYQFSHRLHVTTSTNQVCKTIPHKFESSGVTGSKITMFIILMSLKKRIFHSRYQRYI